VVPAGRGALGRGLPARSGTKRPSPWEQKAPLNPHHRTTNNRDFSCAALLAIYISRCDYSRCKLGGALCTHKCVPRGHRSFFELRDAFDYRSVLAWRAFPPAGVLQATPKRRGPSLRARTRTPKGQGGPCIDNRGLDRGGGDVGCWLVSRKTNRIYVEVEVHGLFF
jgi:hypothetical protein